MPNNGSNPDTHLLSDAPATEDAFEGGHDRVAKALAGLIQDEDGGKAVGLSGPFGSGKSTVIRLLQDKLEEVDASEGEDTRIFTYDAWEHQGDPLRRSFIESIIEFLRGIGWADKNQWNDEIERLARRRETTKVDSEPKLTTWGRWVAVSLFLSPIGLLLLNGFLRTKDSTFQTSSPEVWFWSAGLVLALLPLLLIAVAWLQGSDPFYVLVKKTHQEEKTKTIRTIDPTTIEFQGIFHDIARTTLEDGKRQLIVVVDNLDRLPPEQALSAWATMRTFFDTRGANEHDWMDRFWLIVPLNFKALRGVFTTSAGKMTDSSQNSEGPTNHDSNDEDAVEAFANKTFSTVFRVAPPVLSDWEKFMKDQLREAFELAGSTNLTEEDFHAVYRLYRIGGVEENGIPTPRDIKVFINRLSALYRQWGSDIKLPIMAAFQLKRGEISENGEELTNSEFLPRRMKTELRGDDWQKQLAALHFNVDQSRAIQVLIGGDVQTALETGEDETLEELAGTPGFGAVVDRALTEIVQLGDPSATALAARALSTSNVDVSDIEKDAAWRQLRRGIRGTDDWHPSEERVGEGVLGIIRHTPDGDSRDRLTEQLLETFSGIKIDAPAYERPNDATQWVDGVLPLVRELIPHTDLLQRNFHVPHSWLTYISAVTRLAKEQDAQKLAPFFVPDDTMDVNGIDKAVAEMVSESSIQADHVEGIRLMRFTDDIPETAWDETSKAIYEQLGWNNNLSDEQLHMHLNAALVIAAVYDFHGLQASLGDNNSRANLSHHLYEHRDSDQGIVNLCVLLRVLYSAGQNRVSRNGNADQGHNQFTGILNSPESNTSVIEDVAEIVADYNITGHLLASSRKQNARDFVKHVIRELDKKPEAATLLNANIVRRFPEIIAEALNTDGFKELVLEANAESGVVELLMEVSTDEWVNKLDSEDHLLDVVLILSQEPDVELPSAFRDALEEHANRVLDQHQSAPTRLVDRWTQLLDALSNAQRSSFIQSLQQTLLDRSDVTLAPVLSLYGDVLSDPGVLQDASIPEPTDTVNNHFRPLIQRGNVDELRWLCSILAARPDLSHKANTDIWEAFRETVIKQHGNTDSETRAILEELASTAGIDLPEDEKADSTNRKD